MASMFTSALRRNMLWICVLLSSTFYPAICNLVQDESVAANTDGRRPVFVQKDPKEVKEAPISGFDFYSKDDYGPDWWDHYLALNNEDEFYYSPNIKDEKTNSAVNLKLGDDSNFTNSGDVGFNLIYDLAGTAVNKDIFFESSRFVNPEFQRPTPARANPRSTMAENYNNLLDDNHSQTRMGRLNTAVNLNLQTGSTFGNQGDIGSNFVRQKSKTKIILNKNQSEPYSKQKYSPQAAPWKLGTAVNLNLGPTSKFENTGNIGSNLVSNRNLHLLYEPRYYEHHTSALHSPLDPEQLYSHNDQTSDNQGYVGSKKQRRTMNSAANLDLGPVSTFGNRGKIGSNIHVIRKPAVLRSQDAYNPEILFPSSRPENVNAATNFKTGYGSKVGNKGAIGSNLLYFGPRTKYPSKGQHNMYFPHQKWRSTNSGVNLDLGPVSTFANRGKIGSNIEVIEKPIVLGGYSPISRSDNMNAGANIKTHYGTAFGNEGEIGSNLLYNVARTTTIPRLYSEPYLQYLHRKTLNSAANLDLGQLSTFGNKGKIGSNIIHNIGPDVPRMQNRYDPGITLGYPQSLRQENLNAATNLKTADGAKFGNEGEIGSNYVQTWTNNLQPEVYFPQRRWRAMNSAANLDLGPVSTFGNRGKIGSNIEVIRKPIMLGGYSPISRSDNMNAAANLKTNYGTMFGNEGEIGSNLLYNVARTTGTIPRVYFEPYLPYLHRRTLNSAANVDLGQLSAFGNKGKIGSNIIHNIESDMLKMQNHYYVESDPQSLRQENLNAATNLKTAYGGKFGNEGEIGSNYVQTWANNLQPEVYFPQQQWRSTHSTANLDLDPASTFGDRGKIGANIEVIRKPATLKLQNTHYPEIYFNYLPSSRSENWNAAANLKASYGSKFGNAGAIGSNVLYFGPRTKYPNKRQHNLNFPHWQRRSTNSAVNLDLGPVSTFGNRGKIGSNVELIREPEMLRLQNTYYPEIFLNYPPSSRSENMKAAANFKTDYGTTFGNEGEIGSNFLYFGPRTKYTNKRPQNVYFPQQQQWRTMNSAANLDLGSVSTFGNRGKIGSNIEVIRKPAMLELQNTYYPKIFLNYPASSRSESMKAAANFKTDYGTQFGNEGEIGSNFLYFGPRTKYENKRQQSIYFPKQQWRSMHSAVNLDLGPVSTFGNRGKIGSNIEVIEKPITLGGYSPISRSDNMNAAANIKTNYGTMVGNEGEIGSNLLYNVARTTGTIPRIYFEPYLPYLHRRTLNSAANVDLGQLSTFGNKGKISSNIIYNIGPDVLKMQNRYDPGMTLSYPQSLRQENLNAATNLKTAYGAKFGNEGEIGSNYVQTWTNNLQPEVYFPQQQWRSMNSAANLDLGPVSTFGNRGKIGSNIEIIRKPMVLKPQTILPLAYSPSLRSEDMNTAANFKAGYGTNFGNEGEMGSNFMYVGAGIKYANKEEPRWQWRTMNSAANLDLGPVSTFGNRGKIGSNIEVIRKPAMLGGYSPILRSDNVNAAANTKTSYGTKVVSEGDIGSNLLYNVVKRTSSIPRGYSESYLPYPQTNSGANLNLEYSSGFGNMGNIGSSIIYNRMLGMLKQRSHYIPGIALKYPQSLRPEKLNAATNLNTAYGAKFVNTGEVGSNSLYNMRRRSDNHNNKIHSDTYVSQPHLRTLSSSANTNMRPSSAFSNKGQIGSNNIISKWKLGTLKTQNQYNPEVPLTYSTRSRSQHLNAASNLNTGYGAKFYNEGELGSNLFYSRKKRTINNNRESFSRRNQYLNRESMNSVPTLDFGSNYDFGINLGHEPHFPPEILVSATKLQQNHRANFGNVDSVGTALQRNRYHGMSRKQLQQKDPEAIKSSANLNFEPASHFTNEGDVGSSILRHGDFDFINNRGEIDANGATHLTKSRRLQTLANKNLGSGSSMYNLGNFYCNSKFNMRHKVSGNLGVQNFENDGLFNEAYGYSDPRFHHATSPNKYRGHRLPRTGARNVQSAANLKLGTSARVRNVGTIGSTVILNDDEIRRNAGQRFVPISETLPSSRRIYNKPQYGIPSPRDYDMWALRTAENNVKRKGKGIVNIFIESGSLFENKGPFCNDKYEILTLAPRIKLRGSKPAVTSYAYIIPPGGKGRSALFDGKVVTGISTESPIHQSSADILSNRNEHNTDSKYPFRERSSLINDGRIGAAEILFSRGSVIAPTGSKTQIPNALPAAVSFGKLGLDMTHSSNKASIVAGDNATIVINGKMGVYQVSIPIGSIVASEGSSVHLRTSSPYWNDIFSQSSLPGLRSSLNFLKQRHSAITGVVKVMSTNLYGDERVDLCELENPITAVEIGRPLPSDKLLLHLLLITKLRTNLANLLSYLTAISAANLDERLYESLQILHNAIQYRHINLLPLLLLEQNSNSIPPEYHFRAMLELLENAASLDVRYIIQILIQGIEKQAANHVDISENLIPLLTDTLDVNMIPDIIAQQPRNVLFGDVGVFVNQIVDRAFSKIHHIRSIRELKDIIYLTMLNLPLSYSVPQFPTKLRLAAQMLLMELTDDVWMYAAMRAQYVSSSNVYIGLKTFLNLLLECPTVPANIRAIVWDIIQILPDALPMNDLYDYSQSYYGR